MTTTSPTGAGRHTKGPWRHYDDRASTGRLEIVAMGRTVARVYYKDAQGFADARLIAAAPQMLEALRKVVAYARVACLNEGMPEHAEPTRLTTQVIDAKTDRFALLDVKAIRALIAEVEGRAAITAALGETNND